MTDCSDAEISRRLALAIGWKSRDVRFSEDRRYITVPAGPFGMRRQLDYRDPAVIWPIAERFDCFPEKWPPDYKTWASWLYTESTGGVDVYADTAAKAVALAVIKSKPTHLYAW